MKITFLWVGRTRDAELLRLVERYLTRIGHYATVSTQVAPELKDGSRYSPEHRLEREGAGILERLPARGRSLGLDSRGETPTSKELAAILETEAVAGGGSLHFVLGGPSGLAPVVLARMDRRLSLSRLTLPHEMARLVLVEQIYRALSILRGGPYHR